MRVAVAGLVIRRFALLALLSVQCISAHALVVGVDGLRVTKNGIVFNDTFSDGVPPPSGPFGPTTYGVFGDVTGAETGGRLFLDSSRGGLDANAAGAGRLDNAITLLTSTSVAANGLWVTDNITAGVRFDLVTPAGPDFNAYGIQLNDAGPGIPISENLQISVAYLQQVGAARIQFLNQNFANGIIQTLGIVPLAPPAGADQIDLVFARVLDANGGLTNQFRASYSYVSAGTIIETGVFDQFGTMFEGEDFVRARVFVAEAVIPEPSTYVLMLAGLLGLGAVARRRSPTPAGCSA
jgi:hypothetical protein